MITRLAAVVVLPAAVLLSTAIVTGPTRDQPSKDGLTVHEWGTFTTVAGVDGRAIDWLPLGGPEDLPCFVEHFNNLSLIKIILADDQPPPDYQTARSTLHGKVRMETPVLYFYSPRDVTASVHVQFPRGVMTEWYPHASVTQGQVDATTLANPNYASAIDWQSVFIAAHATFSFPTESGESHYYAARATDALPVSVNGHAEKFLFYRGVANFDVPLAAAVQSDGSMRITNLGVQPLPVVILFENRGGAIGYRVQRALRGDVTLAAPALTATFASLRTDLEQMLVGAGLYQKEASAMVDTWRDSWFEEGTRVFYVLPASTVDATLPLSVTPAPVKVARAFVGRMDVITPTMQQAVEHAVAANDVAALGQYGRLMGPITDRMLANGVDAGTQRRIRGMTNAVFASYLARASVCENSVAGKK
jgi:hypothetical protein